MKLSNAPSSARSAARRAAPRRKAAPVLLLLAVVVCGIVLLRLLLARTLAFKPAYGEALPTLNHALALEPDSSEALALRRLCRMNSNPSPAGQAAAEADLQRAIRIN
jgi:hypothetical protein